MFITFIYKIDSKIFFDKYITDYIPPDHNGLDVIIKSMLQRALEAYKEKYNLRRFNDVNVSILSVCDNMLAYSSSLEQFHSYFKRHNSEIKMYITSDLVISEYDSEHKI